MSILTMLDRFKEKKAPCTAVIVAAGSSTRMGQDKLFLPVAGIPVLARTMLQFQRCREINEIVVVTREERLMDVAGLAKRFGMDKVRKILVGGQERVESSAAGVLQADRNSGYIAVADGARPLVTPELISRTVEAARKYRAAAPAVPVTASQASSPPTASRTILSTPPACCPWPGPWPPTPPAASSSSWWPPPPIWTASTPPSAR